MPSQGDDDHPSPRDGQVQELLHFGLDFVEGLRDGENRSAYWKFLEISENFLTMSYSVFMNLFLLKKDS